MSGFCKSCDRCHLNKPITMFYKNSRMKDGYLGQCIDCTRKARADYRQANAEKIKAQHRMSYLRNRTRRLNAVNAYYKENRHVNRAAVAKYRKRNSAAHTARQTVAYALRTKQLTPKPCEWCGSEPAQAHHENYEKPLDVMWLCTTCHGQRHRQINEELRSNTSC